MDENQVVVWRADYTPFGEVTETVSTVEMPLRFAGQYFDEETGLHQNYFREYQPGSGRYIQSDPIGLEGGTNLYGYAAQNPLRYIDPRGLNPGDISYNKPPPATVPLNPDMEVKMRCVAKCVGMSLVITGGAEQSGHSTGSKHYSGEAADVGFNSNPGIQGMGSKFFCCAAKCGFKFGQNEGNHFHIQVVPGRNGGRGEIPEVERDSCGVEKCK